MKVQSLTAKEEGRSLKANVNISKYKNKNLLMAPHIDIKSSKENFIRCPGKSLFNETEFHQLKKIYYSNPRGWHRDKGLQTTHMLLDQWSEYASSFINIHQHLTCEEHCSRCYASYHKNKTDKTVCVLKMRNLMIP